MSIEIQCVGCSSQLRVPGEHAGKQARCPKCGMIQTIPGRNESGAPVENSVADSPVTFVGQGTAASTAAPTPPTTPTAAQPDLWYMKTPDGREYGPVPRRELDQWVSEARISAESRLRRANEEWMPATTLFPDVPSVDPSFYRSSELISARPANAYAEEHRGSIVLIFGILGLLLTCPIFSIMAWVMGAKDLAKMRAGVMDPSGRDMTRVGYVLGLLWSLLCILVMLCIMFAFIASA